MEKGKKVINIEKLQIVRSKNNVIAVTAHANNYETSN